MDLVHEKQQEKKEAEKAKNAAKKKVSKRKSSLSVLLEGEETDSEDDEPEDEVEEADKFLGISVADLARADITPSTLSKPKSSRSWIWKTVALSASRLRSAEAEDKRRAELEEPLPPLLQTAPHHHPKEWFCGACFNAGKALFWRKYSSPGSVANHLNRVHGLTDSNGDMGKYFKQRDAAKITNEDIDSSLMMALARDNRLIIIHLRTLLCDTDRTHFHPWSLVGHWLWSKVLASRTSSESSIPRTPSTCRVPVRLVNVP
jgi:hypothetical protein